MSPTSSPTVHWAVADSANDTLAWLSAPAKAVRNLLSVQPAPTIVRTQISEPNQALLVLLPLLIVLSTFLFLLLVFLLCVILLRRRRGILLRDHDGPIDMSREELLEGGGGFDTMESRWLESVSESERRSYLRAKDWQLQYPANSLPTDITLSQFLSIQEKGVSAWSFDPDFESLSSLIVQGRTEITFLPDPASPSCVQSNLPLPKLNEVYYWEVKMFELPETTNVAIGLATKPYPYFRLPGLSRYSVAYHSNGDKSHNYPFMASSFGPSLKEGDVVGVGYRPRTGTVFFTRNGRKMEDAYVGLTRWNLFPTIGADGPCTMHVNLGQAGFVFIEANVKKWGLAPSVGTLAPPPAYGSERGSILLQAGGGVTGTSPRSPPAEASRPSSRRSHQRHHSKQSTSSAPAVSSPTLESFAASPPPPMTPPPPITPIEEEPSEGPVAGPSTARRYISPTDMPFHTAPNLNLPSSPPREASVPEEVEGEWDSEPTSRTTSRSATPEVPGTEFAVRVTPPPDSPMTPNPPTPNPRDIHLQALNPTSVSDGDASSLSPNAAVLDHVPSLSREPPDYSPLDPYAYADGVHIDLPADVIAAALERGVLPSDAATQTGGESERMRQIRVFSHNPTSVFVSESRSGGGDNALSPPLNAPRRIYQQRCIYVFDDLIQCDLCTSMTNSI